MEETSNPVVVDFGKHKRKRVKQLTKGKGPLMDEVNDVVAEMKANGTIDAGAQPVVVVVRSKNKRGWMRMGR